jgi:hypothetical protein
VSRDPQVPQNLSPGATGAEQEGQLAASAEPHSTQNCRPGLFSVPQLVQINRRSHAT